MTTTSKTPSSGRSRIISVLLIANAVLWVIFWAGFFSHSVAYPKVPTPTEGIPLPEVVGHRAANPDLAPNRDTYFQVSFIPNSPSFLLTRVLFNIPTHGYRSPDLYLGTTAAGYELLCWMLMSFLQWYLIGRVAAWLVSRRRQPHVAVVH